MKQLVHNPISYWIFNITIWFFIFTFVPIIFQVLLYQVLPFDYFVKFNRYDTQYASVGLISTELNREAQFDIKANSVKELYRIEEDGFFQVYEAPKREFIFETETNNDKILFSNPVPELTPGEYYVSDTVTLELPRGVEKVKTIKSNTFIVK